MNQVSVNGITMAYEDVGAGENVLVLVHGLPFNRTMWRPQVEWIANLNRARARPRARSERVESLEEVVWPGDRGPAELLAPPNSSMSTARQSEESMENYRARSSRIRRRGFGQDYARRFCW